MGEASGTASGFALGAASEIALKNLGCVSSLVNIKVMPQAKHAGTTLMLIEQKLSRWGAV